MATRKIRKNKKRKTIRIKKGGADVNKVPDSPKDEPFNMVEPNFHVPIPVSARGSFAIRRASSTRGLYSMTLVNSIPHEAVTKTFGFASSIRIANSFGANPPKTTE